jgi:hypothetical protein
MKIIKAFKCEHCRSRVRIYSTKSACASHEERCFGNPTSRSCATCKFKGSRNVHAPGEVQKQFPGCITTEYICQAARPGKCLTTLCPSWERKVDPDE